MSALRGLPHKPLRVFAVTAPNRPSQRVNGGRLTSARAERTTAASRRPVGATAHLRSRGEDRCAEDVGHRGLGSPPLARRGQVPVTRLRHLRRLTSARAERTGGGGSGAAARAAHLRSRGEDSACRGLGVGDLGSPPLARRGLGLPRSGGGRSRLTSARAERTSRSRARSTRRTAHLRSRGEDASSGGSIRWCSGSPPLARRGLGCHLHGIARSRLTSARAERTPSRGRGAGPWPAHLRSRGEDGVDQIDKNDIRGSPPLARRGRCALLFVAFHPRLTSARAERTVRLEHAHSEFPAHLRSRGEDSW